MSVFPKYSIVIPAYNESARIDNAMQEVESCIRARGWDAELIVVNDGSTDTTAQKVGLFSRTHANVRLVHNPNNCGKGYSVRNGILHARGEVVMFTDADLSAPIEEFEKLWNAVKDGEAGVAIGSRALDRSLIGVHQPGFRESAGKVFNFVMQTFVGLHIHDTQCGFKLFRGDAASQVFERQRIERFGFDVEALFVARKLGFRIAEVPIRWNHVEGSKVGMLNGAQSFVDLVKIRWYQMTGKYR